MVDTTWFYIKPRPTKRSQPTSHPLPHLPTTPQSRYRHWNLYPKFLPHIQRTLIPSNTGACQHTPSTATWTVPTPIPRPSSNVWFNHPRLRSSPNIDQQMLLVSSTKTAIFLLRTTPDFLFLAYTDEPSKRMLNITTFLEEGSTTQLARIQHDARIKQALHSCEQGSP